jgi:alginate O-acetyltransferase complex protein AlgJ
MLLLGMVEAILPCTYFTHRPWEAVFFQSKIPHQTIAYPNLTIEMEAEGDLCYNTRNAIRTHQTWKTDKLGYRNDNFIEQADVIIIGDSYIAGSNTNQNKILSNQIMDNAHRKIKVYNMAPSLFSKFDEYHQKGTLKKPKWIIFSSAERIPVPGKLRLYRSSHENNKSEKAKEIASLGNINIPLDKALRHYSLNWMRARLKEKSGSGCKSSTDSTFYFLEGKNQKNMPSDLNHAVEQILSYKKYCDSMGIQFLYLPMPDKESVYFEAVPFQNQPRFLFDLNLQLQQSGINTIHTLALYNAFRSKHSKLLYNPDDSHWNATAISIVAKEIVTKILL